MSLSCIYFLKTLSKIPSLRPLLRGAQVQAAFKKCLTAEQLFIKESYIPVGIEKTWAGRNVEYIYSYVCLILFLLGVSYQLLYARVFGGNFLSICYSLPSFPNFNYLSFYFFFLQFSMGICRRYSNCMRCQILIYSTGIFLRSSSFSFHVFMMHLIHFPFVIVLGSQNALI